MNAPDMADECLHRIYSKVSGLDYEPNPLGT